MDLGGRATQESKPRSDHVPDHKGQRLHLRKADREGEDGLYLDPAPIPRFYCRRCQATCSRLPSCIAPR
ncbi:hypothetical protein MNBD_GAMMA18-1356, partial [hydrothermal vent metagenome]